MKKLYSVIFALIIVFSALSADAYDTPVNFLVNGNTASFEFAPIIRDGITYVDFKSLASKLGLDYRTFSYHNSVTVENSRISACFVPGSDVATIADLTGKSDAEYYYRFLSAPCIYINNHLAIAARDLASIFGYYLSYDAQTETVFFGYSPRMITSQTRDIIKQKAYYYQNQAEFALPSSGSGYCWTCSYAMLITNVTGKRVTPNDIAAINLSMGSSGAYCHHSKIVEAYNLRFVDAIPPSSVYYGGRDSVSGGTFINNPYKSDEVATAALKEALTLHPEGVMVRYADYPHTIVAVGFQDDIILFNDPAPVTSVSKNYRGVPFCETCISDKGFSLADLTHIQAIG